MPKDAAHSGGRGSPCSVVPPQPFPSHSQLGTPGSPLPPCLAVGNRGREWFWGARSWVPPMRGAAGHHEVLAAFAELHKWCFPPIHLQASQGVAVLVGEEGAGVPRRWPTLLLACRSPGTPQPASIPSPRDSQALPPRCLAQSGALRDTVGLCPTRAHREGAGCPLQASPALCWLHSCSTPESWGHPWELWHPWDMGHPRELGYPWEREHPRVLAPSAAALEPYLSPEDPRGVPTQALFPHGG